MGDAIFVSICICLFFISSFTFAGDPTEGRFCGVGRHWVKAHFRRAYTRADGTHFKATNVRAHCSDNPPGYVFWTSKLKDGPPPSWGLQNEIPGKWTEEEIERIMEALGYLPEQLTRNDIRGIYRMVRSIMFPNPASGNHAGDIVIYDNGFEGNENLAQILAHEIAHRIYDSLSVDERQSYRFAAGWIDFNAGHGAPSYVLTRQKMVDPDSANSVEEDFSNNVEFFLFNPLKLKDCSAGAYNWISGHFGANFKIGKGSPK